MPQTVSMLSTAGTTGKTGHGKRAFIPEKDTIDHELQSAEGLEDAVNILCAFLESIAKATGLLEDGNNTGSYHRLIEMAKQYILENCAGDVSLERVAREVGFSSFYLSKLFKKEEGINENAFSYNPFKILKMAQLRIQIEFFVPTYAS